MKFTILIFCFTLLSSQLTEATTGIPVVDGNGYEVLPDVDYYIVPTIWAWGGGLTLRERNGTCPLRVAQEPSEVNPGLRLRFHPIDPKAKFVTLNTDMNVAFSEPVITVCPPEPLVWKMHTDPETGKAYVGIGGEIGNPGPATFANWFKLEEHVPSWGIAGYKLVFSPDPEMCPSCTIMCSDLGIVDADWGRWLEFAEPFPPLVIRKAAYKKYV